MDFFIDVNAQEQNEGPVIEETQLNIMQASVSSQKTASSQNQVNGIFETLFIAILEAKLKEAQEHEKRAKLVAELAAIEDRRKAGYVSALPSILHDEVYSASNRAQIVIERGMKIVRSDKYKDRNQHELDTFRQFCENYFEVKRVIYRYHRARLGFASALLEGPPLDAWWRHVGTLEVSQHI